MVLVGIVHIQLVRASCRFVHAISSAEHVTEMFSCYAGVWTRALTHT